MPEIIKLESAGKYYGRKGRGVNALADISLIVAPGEFVAVTGPSGAGKTTLLNVLGLMDRPDSGKYYFEGADTADWKGKDISSALSRKIGFVFQAFNLLPGVSAGENIALALDYAGYPRDDGYIRGCLEAVGLGGLEGRLPDELSAGQRQRLAIARAVAKRPDVIFADEPTGNLDAAAAAGVMELLRSLNAAGATIVLVTHDLGLAERAGRIIKMRNGRIETDLPADGREAARPLTLPAAGQSGARGGCGTRRVFKYAWDGLLRRPLRSAAITAAVMAGAYLGNMGLLNFRQLDPARYLAGIRPDRVYVFPGQKLQNGGLSNGDISALSGVGGVKEVLPVFSAYTQVRTAAGSVNAAVYGMPEVLAAENLTLTGSVWPGAASGEALLGENLAARLYSREDSVGRDVYVSGVKFKVAGVFSAKPGKRTMGPSAGNALVLTPKAFGRLGAKGASIASVQLAVPEASALEVEKEARAVLNKRNAAAPGDDTRFEIYSGRGRIENVLRKRRGAAFFVGGALLLPFLLAGLLISNLMLLSMADGRFVTGVLISLGAGRPKIFAAHALQAALLAAAGCFLGAIFSLPAGLKNMAATFLALLLVCLVSLIYPAVKFSAMRPADSLRE